MVDEVKDVGFGDPAAIGTLEKLERDATKLLQPILINTGKERPFKEFRQTCLALAGQRHAAILLLSSVRLHILLRFFLCGR